MKKNTAIILICHSQICNMLKQFLAPGGLSAQYVQVIVSCKPGASRVSELALRLGSKGLRSSKCSEQFLAPGGLSAECVMF